MQLNFTINIDERIVNFFKRICTRRNVVTAIIAATIGASIFVYAQTADIIAFQPGTVIKASDMNANFAALAAKGHVFDAADTDLGLFISSTGGFTDASATILSPTGYLYSMTWAGSMVRPSMKQGESFPKIYYASADCSGTAYISDASGTAKYYTKMIISDSTRSFRPKLVGGTFVGTTSNFPSMYSTMMNCSNAGATPYTSSVYELEAVTNTNIGLPATVTPPLTIRP